MGKTVPNTAIIINNTVDMTFFSVQKIGSVQLIFIRHGSSQEDDEHLKSEKEFILIVCQHSNAINNFNVVKQHRLLTIAAKKAAVFILSLQDVALLCL